MVKRGAAVQTLVDGALTNANLAGNGRVFSREASLKPSNHVLIVRRGPLCLPGNSRKESDWTSVGIVRVP